MQAIIAVGFAGRPTWIGTVVLKLTHLTPVFSTYDHRGTDVATTAGPLLTYDRVAENRRRTRVVLLLFPLAALPSVLFFGEYLMLWAALSVGLLLSLVVPGDLSIGLFLLANIVVTAITMVAAVVVVYRTSMRRVLRSLRARPLAAGVERPFEQVVENMAIASGLPTPNLYRIDSNAMNLAAVGVSPETSSIIATSGLLSMLDRVELEAVVAHAFSQIGNRDTRLLTLLAAGTIWLRLPRNIAGRFLRGLFSLASRAGIPGFGCLGAVVLWMGVPMLLALQWGLSDPSVRPWIAAALAVNWYVFFGAPLAALVITRYASRERKHLADADAVLLTRNPGALARALAKIGEVGSKYGAAGGEVAALHFADPLQGAAGWLDRAFDTHPLLEQRLMTARRLGGMVSDSEIQRAIEDAGIRRRQQEALGPESRPT